MDCVPRSSRGRRDGMNKKAWPLRRDWLPVFSAASLEWGIFCFHTGRGIPEKRFLTDMRVGGRMCSRANVKEARFRCKLYFTGGLAPFRSILLMITFTALMESPVMYSTRSLITA